MSQADDVSYEAIYRNTPFAGLGFIAILAAAALAGWGAIALGPQSDLLLYAAEITIATIAGTGAVVAASRSRHRWSVRAGVVEVSEASALSRLLGVRSARIPLSSISSVRRIESGLDSLLELETNLGERHWLMQGFIRDTAGILRADRDGFERFANVLRRRVADAGATDPSFHDGLGFWNKVTGLGLLTGFLILTLGLSGLILYGVFAGVQMPNGAAMQGLAVVLLLPFGIAYALYQSWSRRNFVLGLAALRSKLKGES